MQNFSCGRYRSARQQEVIRRRIEMRRQAVRELRGRENAAFRNGTLPRDDNPPSYAHFALNSKFF